MSRVGRRPIKLPSGVTVTYKPPVVEVSGKGGKLRANIPSSLNIDIKGPDVNVIAIAETDNVSALHGLTRTVLNNMVRGVAEGYSKALELQGVGYRAQVQGTKLTMTVGFSHPVEFTLPAGITATVEANTKILIKGADKALVGLIASQLRKIRPPEPYKGKGIRYSGEVISLKQGKAAGAGGK